MNKKLLLACLLTGAMAFANQLHAQPTPTLPFVEILATDPTALEGTSSGSFTLIRDGDTNADLTVNFGIYGSASNGVDYVPLASAVVIPAGYLAVDIPVEPVVDTDNRGNKTVILKIDTNGDYQTGGAHQAVVTIIDDVFNNPNPTVLITDPTNGSSFSFPADITITADASDSAGITSVSFYADDDFIGRATNAPYTINWANARPGRYTLFARAIDSLNQSSLSPLVQITVTEVLPVATITTPTNGQNFIAHQSIPIAATVVDAGASATISNVVFYANGRPVGKVTNGPPYQVTWSNLPQGFYELQAAATDSSGQTGYSKGVEINVSRP